MVSRRLLRIKVMQVLYAYFKSEDSNIEKFEKELFFSINKVYDLYHYLMLLILDIANYAESRIDLAKQKYIPSEKDLHPNTKFINNQIIKQLSVNKQLNFYLSNHKLTWVNYPELIKSIYNSLIKSKHYNAYLAEPEISYLSDKQFIIKILENDIAASELLYQVLEEQSIYWNDDVEFVIGMIIKTLEKFKEPLGENCQLMPLFKNEDDRDFVKTLFRKSILNHKEYNELIETHTKNWDVERIAFMDVLLMEMALTEISEMRSIPTKVSFDEYIEIAKFYSTEKSNTFINGILDKIIGYLKSQNRIIKTGRGLVGD